MRIPFLFFLLFFTVNKINAQWKPIYLRAVDTAFLEINRIQEFEGKIYVSSNQSGPATLNQNGLSPQISGLEKLEGSGLIATSNNLFYLGNSFYKFNTGQWQKLNSNFNPLFINVYTTFNDDIIAGTSQNGLFYYSSNSNQWIAKNSGILDNRIINIHSNDTTCVVLAGNNQIYISSDSANNWNSINLNINEELKDVFITNTHLVIKDQNNQISAINLDDNSTAHITNSNLFIKNKSYFVTQTTGQLFIYNENLNLSHQLNYDRDLGEIFDLYHSSNNWYLASDKGLYTYDTINLIWKQVHNGSIINNLKKLERGDHIFSQDNFQIYKITDSAEIVYKSNNKILDFIWINSGFLILSDSNLTHINENGQLINEQINPSFIEFEKNKDLNEIYFLDSSGVKRSNFISPFTITNYLPINSNNPNRKIKKLYYSNNNLFGYGDSGLYKIRLNPLDLNWSELDTDNKIRTRKVLDLIVINDKLIVKPGIGCLISYNGGQSFEDYFFNPLFRFVNSLSHNDSFIWAQGNDGIIYSDIQQLQFKDFKNTLTSSEPALMNDFMIDESSNVISSSESGLFMNDLQQILKKQKQLTHGIKIYPNPFHNSINIDTELEIKWTIYNTQGESIAEGQNKTITLEKNYNKLIIIKIETINGIEFHKLIHID